MKTMSTHIEIGRDTKARIKRLSVIEGTTMKEITARAVGLYELMILRRELKKKEKISEELWQEILETLSWLRRESKMKFKELTKVKGNG